MSITVWRGQNFDGYRDTFAKTTFSVSIRDLARQTKGFDTNTDTLQKLAKVWKPMCHTLISIAFIFLCWHECARWRPPGNKGWVGKRWGEGSLLADKSGRSSGICIWILYFCIWTQIAIHHEGRVWKRWCIWIKESVTYIWIKDENPFQHIETLIFVQNPPVCREEEGLSRAGKSGKSRSHVSSGK